MMQHLKMNCYKSDSNVNDKTHLQFFENIQDCNVYMLENKLYTTHLVFDLTSAKCVNVHESTNNNITHY